METRWSGFSLDELLELEEPETYRTTYLSTGVRDELSAEIDGRIFDDPPVQVEGEYPTFVHFEGTD